MKHKIVLVFSTLLMCGTLAACGNNQKQASKGESENSSLKRQNSELKKKAKEQSSSSTSQSSHVNHDQQLVNSTQSSNGQTITVQNKDQAIAIARARYGDDNGDWDWICLQDSYNGSYNSSGYYFVKAISRRQIANGSMTGTAMSCKVYPDGSISEY